MLYPITLSKLLIDIKIDNKLKSYTIFQKLNLMFIKIEKLKIYICIDNFYKWLNNG